MNIPREFRNFWNQEKLDIITNLIDIKGKLDSDDLYQFDIKDGKRLLHGLQLLEVYKNIHSISNINFYFSSFKNCNFKQTEFSNVNLSQCTFDNCYLKETKFENCILIGTKFNNCDMPNSDFFESVVSYLKFTNCNVTKGSFDKVKSIHGNMGNQRTIHRNLRDVYIQLKANSYARGDFELANFFKEKELKCATKDLFERKRIFSWLASIFLNIITGYGYKPLNVIMFSLITILLYSLIYMVIGFENANQTYMFNKVGDNLTFSNLFITSLYFSTVTFTTLGYGDFHPIDNVVNLIVTPFESLLGAFSIGLFVAVLINRFFRG